MTRSRLFGLLVAGAAVVAVGAACGDLFDTPTQCTTDRDCLKWSAKCDVSRGVCGALLDGIDGAIISPDSSLEDSPTPDPGCVVPNKPVFDLAAVDVGGGIGEITQSFTLECTRDWRLTQRVVIRSGVTLTISPNTTIRAAAGSALIVQRGARLVATGFRDQPIVFTSDEATPAPGDWLGVYFAGAAPGSNANFGNDPLLAFGGANASDDSGSLGFVRIEYSTTGLVLAGVGKGTKVDYVQARKLTGDAFTFAGGTVDAKHLVAQYHGDEAFEMSGNFTGKLQFLFAHRPPGGAGHHMLVADSSNPVIYNATVCGGSQTDPNYALVVRGDTGRVTMHNAILTGCFGGVDLVSTPAMAPTPIEVRGSLAFGNAGNPAYDENTDAGTANDPQFDDDNGFNEIGWFNEPTRSNKTDDPALEACADPTAPKPWPNAAITGGASTPPNDGFFDVNAAFIGAFRDANDSWMTGAWLRFSDQ